MPHHVGGRPLPSGAQSAPAKNGRSGVDARRRREVRPPPPAPPRPQPWLRGTLLVQFPSLFDQLRCTQGEPGGLAQPTTTWCRNRRPFCRGTVACCRDRLGQSGPRPCSPASNNDSEPQRSDWPTRSGTGGSDGSTTVRIGAETSLGKVAGQLLASRDTPHSGDHPDDEGRRQRLPGCGRDPDPPG
jgi:hypothetical protein